LAWCENCYHFQISRPYVHCLNGDSIKIYSLYDSKIKQEISFSQARSFEYIDEENVFIISTPVQIFFIYPHTQEKQLEQLLTNDQVDEALYLFECLNAQLNPEEFLEVRLRQFHFNFIDNLFIFHFYLSI
jgi:hypothetical protein